MVSNVMGVSNVGGSYNADSLVAGMSGIAGDNIAFFADGGGNAYQKAVSQINNTQSPPKKILDENFDWGMASSNSGIVSVQTDFMPIEGKGMLDFRIYIRKI